MSNACALAKRQTSHYTMITNNWELLGHYQIIIQWAIRQWLKAFPKILKDLYIWKNGRKKKTKNSNNKIIVRLCDPKFTKIYRKKKVNKTAKILLSIMALNIFFIMSSVTY